MLTSFFKKNIKKSYTRVRKKKTSEFLSQEEMEYKKYRDQAIKILEARTYELAQKNGFVYNKVTIKNTKTRWGSCSNRKNINLHYKLMFLDDDLRDYVIIHELCHLREMNHSHRYWREVQAIIPHYKESVKKMRSLHPKKIRPNI